MPVYRAKPQSSIQSSRMAEAKEVQVSEANKSGFRGYSIQDPARILIFNQLNGLYDNLKELEEELFSLGYFRLRTALKVEQNLNVFYSIIQQKLEYPRKDLFRQGHKFRRDWHWPVMAYLRTFKVAGQERVPNKAGKFDLLGVQTWIDFFTMFVEEDGITKFERPADLFKTSAFSELDV